ncbi:MAG TPA: serine/threonine-protein kinase [Tepidisphaeraceae bacterium]|jgi:serine/threonine-protein kinase
MPRTLFGYEVLQHLGNGAGSRIYAVSQPSTKQVYALKHVVRSDDKAIRFVEQLENEYTVSRQVRHGNLRGVIDYHVQRSMMLRVTEAALVMELVDGVPLDVRLPRRTSDLLAIFVKTARALQAMHESNFVHCDLKPANILASDTGSVRVIDLGQACPIGTTKARIQGTPDYIAPEQVKCKPVSPQTDVYNFGASMYWALCGRKMPTLFTLKKGENSFLVDSQLETPSKINPAVPENLSSFVMECVRTNAAKRPASMKTVGSRLEILHHTIVKSEAGPQTGE